MFKIIDSNFLSGTRGNDGVYGFLLPEAHQLDRALFSYENCSEIRLLNGYVQTEQAPKSNKFLLGILGAPAGPIGAVLGVLSGMVYDYFNPPGTKVVGYDIEFSVRFKDGLYFVGVSEQEDYKTMVKSIQNLAKVQVFDNYSVVKFVH
ncbi:hypothetical protein [Pelistega ratti]|uniref:hypothetical protein n=1 Tax=Pelistega ratti TaxID=2652177 RepID=UPI00135C4C4E|nr:hypothetical protein [Pelistega ratti]